MDQTAPIQPITEAERSSVYDDLFHAVYYAIEKAEITEEDAQESADFILKRLDTIQTKQELLTFLEELANKWTIYSNVFLLAKSENQTKEKIQDIQQQIDKLTVN